MLTIQLVVTLPSYHNGPLNGTGQGPWLTSLSLLGKKNYSWMAQWGCSCPLHYLVYMGQPWTFLLKGIILDCATASVCLGRSRGFFFCFFLFLFKESALGRFFHRVPMSVYVSIYISVPFQDKSRNLSKTVLVLLSASVERFFVSCMKDFFLVLQLKNINTHAASKGSVYIVWKNGIHCTTLHCETRQCSAVLCITCKSCQCNSMQYSAVFCSVQ